tara:strand:- start:925 stop:1983 length:1059 start_codon:yes stop_codon:yes gene_type:complete
MKALAALLLFLSASLAFSTTTIPSRSDPGRLYYTGLLGNRATTGNIHFRLDTLTGYPPNLDLREIGQVSAIKDQGSCGSCWAFAITKTLESARLRAGGSELNLAEQEMVSCDTHAYGCSGGFMDEADYIVRRGLPLEAAYPYTARNGRCRSTLPPVADKAVSWAYIGAEGRAPTVDELKTAISTYGVIFVTVSAGGADWGGSRVHMTGCSNRGTNHMVTLVGYNQNDEFIIGNSWGTDWGENGFAYAKRGCNGLANEVQGAAFIVYQGGPAPIPPHVRLPRELTIVKGTTAPIGVHDEPGVVYTWYVGTTEVGTGAVLWVTPDADTTYKLVGKSNAGTAESSVIVKVVTQPI